MKISSVDLNRLIEKNFNNNVTSATVIRIISDGIIDAEEAVQLGLNGNCEYYLDQKDIDKVKNALDELKKERQQKEENLKKPQFGLTKNPATDSESNAIEKIIDSQYEKYQEFNLSLLDLQALTIDYLKNHDNVVPQQFVAKIFKILQMIYKKADDYPDIKIDNKNLLILAVAAYVKSQNDNMQVKDAVSSMLDEFRDIKLGFDAEIKKHPDIKVNDEKLLNLSMIAFKKFQKGNITAKDVVSNMLSEFQNIKQELAEEVKKHPEIKIDEEKLLNLSNLMFDKALKDNISSKDVVLNMLAEFQNIKHELAEEVKNYPEIKIDDEKLLNWSMIAFEKSQKDNVQVRDIVPNMLNKFQNIKQELAQELKRHPEIKIDDEKLLNWANLMFDKAIKGNISAKEVVLNMLNEFKNIEQMITNEAQERRNIDINKIDLSYWSNLVFNNSLKYDMPAEVIIAIISRETKFSKNAGGSNGAGAMQITTIPIKDILSDGWDKHYKALEPELYNDIMSIVGKKSASEIRSECAKNDDLSIKIGILLLKMCLAKAVDARLNGKSTYATIGKTIDKINNGAVEITQEDIRRAFQKYNGSSIQVAYANDVLNSYNNLKMRSMLV